MHGPQTGGEAPERAFAALFERTSQRVYGYVRRHCDDADCDDVVSEVYLVAWRRFDEVPPEPVPWLLATARRVLANHWRSRDRRSQLGVELRAVAQLATNPDPARMVADRDTMLAALGTLAADDRELLLLIGWDGLDAAGAAEVLGCSPVAARARLSRARHRLTNALSAADTEPVTSGGS
ncbi:MAG: sigma-70 family RNA polymerase sigma factor [Propionibacteriaceae bacterium]|nr:sigma-70 family RNA polymerase sigma factor [Propionibacteriaceae bacterium]